MASKLVTWSAYNSLNSTHRAPTGPQGAVRQPYQNGNAQRNQIQTLHFSIATAKSNF